jgi:uncharacterized protein (DUF2252 family)
MSAIVGEILKFNAGREPERLAIKYRTMRQNAFAFMRGTCHLFYRDWPAGDRKLNAAPAAWICGDLHLENFGCYKGDNRQVYFDLNDFDEAALAPATWELGRWLTSIVVAAETLALSRPDALALCRLGVESYSAALREGNSRWLERETAKGMIKDLLDPLRRRVRKNFLDGRTTVKKGQRTLKLDGKRALELATRDKEAIMAFVRDFARTRPNPAFFQPLDAARRIAGTGSLGLDRTVILVVGRGSPDGNFLLDLKQAVPSALRPYLKVKQPEWQSEAERVITVQRWAQAISPAFLNVVDHNDRKFVLKGLQPASDKLALTGWNGKHKRLERVITSMGELIAWSHLRSCGRSGSASADDWVAFGRSEDWQAPLLAYADEYGRKIASDWDEYAKEFDESDGKWTRLKIAAHADRFEKAAGEAGTKNTTNRGTKTR